MTEIDALINRLSQDAASSTVHPRPSLMVLTFFLVALTYGSLLLLVFFHPRPDLLLKLSQPWFVAEIFALLLLVATTSLGATLLAFPDTYQKRWLIFAPLVAGALFVMIVGMEAMNCPPVPLPDHDIECLLSISLATLLPAVVIFARIRRMACVHPALAGGMALLAAFSIAALALRLSEPTDSMIHLMQWHYLPMIAVTIIGLALGKIAFKW